jgi:hypothetical protein
VAGVFAEADIGDEDELSCGWRCLEGAQPLLDNAVLIPGSGALLVLGLGQAEKEQAADATASSTERLKTPGMELTSRRTPSPGQRKRG